MGSVEERLDHVRGLLRRIDGKWTLPIMAQLAENGPQGFCQLKATLAVDGKRITSQTLSETLVKLVRLGLLVHGDAASSNYRLSGYGRKVTALLVAVGAAHAAMADDAAVQGTRGLGTTDQALPAAA